MGKRLLELWVFGPIEGIVWAITLRDYVFV